MPKVCLIIGFLFAATTLPADTLLFTASSTDGCQNGEACGGTALFSVIDNNEFTITLSNSTTSIHDAGQLLTGMEFTFNPGESIALESSYGTFIDIGSGGVVTSQGSGSTGWGFGHDDGPNNWILCVVCNNSGVSAGATPTHGIVDNETKYTSGNGSIDNNKGHNPFMESGATFTFETSFPLNTLDGADPLSNVFLSFGTSGGYMLPDSVSSTPEPACMFLAGGGLLFLGLVGRRRTGSSRRSRR